jgi:hypothetical protein
MIVSKEDFYKLKGKENKLYQQLTDNLLSDTGKGGLLSNIE